MQSLSLEQLMEWKVRDKDILLINALPREAFEEKHIPQSINIPYDDPEFAGKVEDIAVDKNRNIVVYCAHFDCDASTKAARKLEEAGFAAVWDYEGDTKEWFERFEEARDLATEHIREAA